MEREKARERADCKEKGRREWRENKESEDEWDYGEK